MFRLVECNNPTVLNAIVSKRRYNNKSDVDFIYIDGKKMCKWCCEKECPTYKHAYCSDKCKLSATLTLKPQCREGAVYLLFRQRFKCAHCGYSWKEAIRSILSYFKKRNEDPTIFKIGRRISGIHQSEYQQSSWFDWAHVKPHRGAQIDHIIPIWDNGDTFGFDNLQALCVPCHSNKSARENKLRQHKKRISIGGNQ